MLPSIANARIVAQDLLLEVELEILKRVISIEFNGLFQLLLDSTSRQASQGALKIETLTSEPVPHMLFTLARLFRHSYVVKVID